MIIGYAWNKISGTNHDADFAALRARGARKIFTDSGEITTMRRSGFRQLLAYAHAGDEVIVPSLLALGQHNEELAASVQALYQRGIVLNVRDLPSFSSAHDAGERAQLTGLLRDVFVFAHDHEGQCDADSPRDLLVHHAERGRRREYAPDSDDPVKRGIYRDVLRMLQTTLPIAQIARKVAINRKQVYRIKAYAQENGDLQTDPHDID